MAEAKSEAASMKVVLINGAVKWPGVAGGRLNATFIKEASDFFKSRGWKVDTTVIEDMKYDIEEETKKIAAADVVFFQTPIFWMGVPWQFKRYIDDVYFAGIVNASFAKSDGRHADTPQDGYGTGGLLKGKYMLSLTANVPPGAFNRADQFFKGQSVDEAWSFFHRTQKFVGLTKIPDSTFIAHDVMKNPQVENDIKRFRALLNNLFPEKK